MLLTLPLILSLACVVPKKPTIYLPTFAALPVPVASEDPNGNVCMDLENANKAREREQLHQIREQTLWDMLKALGAVETPTK